MRTVEKIIIDTLYKLSTNNRYIDKKRRSGNLKLGSTNGAKHLKTSPAVTEV